MTQESVNRQYLRAYPGHPVRLLFALPECGYSFDQYRARTTESPVLPAFPPSTFPYPNQYPMRIEGIPGISTNNPGRYHVINFENQ